MKRYEESHDLLCDRLMHELTMMHLHRGFPQHIIVHTRYEEFIMEQSKGTMWLEINGTTVHFSAARSGLLPSYSRLLQEVRNFIINTPRIVPPIRVRICERMQSRLSINIGGLAYQVIAVVGARKTVSYCGMDADLMLFRFMSPEHFRDVSFIIEIPIIGNDLEELCTMISRSHYIMTEYLKIHRESPQEKEGNSEDTSFIKGPI